jgi:hypothetical protein
MLVICVERRIMIIILRTKVINMKCLTNAEIRSLLAEKVLTMEDKSKEHILRHLIFSLAENINWQDVYDLMLENMPELND